MTPLAQRIVREGLLPPRRRAFVDKCGLLERMVDIHCFELSSEVVDIAVQMASVDVDGFRAMVEDVSFLPAARTWVEWAIEGKRFGCLYEAAGRGARVYLAGDQWSGGESLEINLADSGGDPELFRVPTVFLRAEEANEPVFAFLAQFHAYLALINANRVTSRVAHAPHRGLQRELLKRRGNSGKYPLHAWNTVTLKVPPILQDMSDEPPGQAGFTGSRVYHFVRAHNRWPGGRRVKVEHHWRGDPSMGVKRTRYALVH